jgi:hypothetical protein
LSEDDMSGEHIKYVWCIHNQATGSFQPENYVEVIACRFFVAYCEVAVNEKRAHDKPAHK